jgi:hypothetical protein
MTSDERWFPSHLKELGEPECLELLAEHRDEYTQTGWSVLVRGSAAYVDPTDLPADEDRPHTWAEGQRTLHVRITPHNIAGRRLLPA